MAAARFDDLPLVVDDNEVRRVHNTAGLYFVKRGGVAHAAMDCDHLDWTRLANNPAWRVATDAQCRALRIACAWTVLESPVLIAYVIIDDSSSPTHVLGEAVDVFVRREDAERFIDEVRGDDPEVAAKLRIEERRLEAGGLN